MVSRVIQLSSGGLTPALRVTSDQFGKDLWEAINKATDAGMPAGLLIGQLEFVKAAIIDHHFQRVKSE